MADKKISGRMQQKYDTTANWTAASSGSFIPLKGEVIVYSDTKQMKIGDGTTTVGNLPFVKAQSIVSKNSSTLNASSWSSNTYSFEAYYPSSTYNIEVELAPTATSAEYKAYGKAGLTGNASTNVLTALGTVPTIDIPIILTVQEK